MYALSGKSILRLRHCIRKLLYLCRKPKRQGSHNYKRPRVSMETKLKNFRTCVKKMDSKMSKSEVKNRLKLSWNI